MKFSKQGESLNPKESSKQVPKAKRAPQPHLMYAVAFAYLNGARVQLSRYRDATNQEDAVTKVYECMHESSSLFEDLATVAKYTEICGDTHEHNRLWIDVRNHIRHDIREEFDNEDHKQKIGRANRLGLNPKLQMDIGFGQDAIKVGSTDIDLSTIESYLVWAGEVMEREFGKAIDKGQIEGMSRVEGKSGG